ncbi:hypothetical protein L5G28_12390 [Gordonia sp. HY285]|uniref:hypothetical protein n=1 Tax=Gordonia liuliyuniae TaxID=2911517 RepID=UPI001F291D9F|nr:hypothetical protein [Gordonia liuliyuniae]MCF8610948.1 hypothetical protein [Gordonia liuliyuniae]
MDTELLTDALENAAAGLRILAGVDRHARRSLFELDGVLARCCHDGGSFRVFLPSIKPDTIQVILGIITSHGRFKRVHRTRSEKASGQSRTETRQRHGAS